MQNININHYSNGLDRIKDFGFRKNTVKRYTKGVFL